MQFVAALNIITMLTSALQGVFNMIGAAVPVSQIIADHVKNGTNSWTDEQRDQIVKALTDAHDTSSAQITAAGAPPSA